MSGFRNYNPVAKAQTGAADDDDDWRDNEDYSTDEQHEKPTQNPSSISQRVAQMGHKIPSAAPPPTFGLRQPAPQEDPPKPASSVGSSYAAYLQKNQQQLDEEIETVEAGHQGSPPLQRRVSVSERIKNANKVASAAAAAASGASAVAPKPAAAPKPVAAKSFPSLSSAPSAPSTVSKAPLAPFSSAAAVSSHHSTEPTHSVSNNPFVMASKESAVPVPTMPAFPRKTSAPTVQPYRETAAEAGGVNIQALAQRFPIFSASEVSAFHQQFSSVDKEGHNTVHISDLSSVAPKAGESVQNVVEKLSQMSLVKTDGLVSFESFLSAVSRLRQDKGVAVGANKGRIVLHGQTSENVTHTINEDEKQSFVEHINSILEHDKDIKHRFPIDIFSMQVFAECKDGIVLAKLINDSVPNTIDERVLNLGKKLNTFQMTENNNVVVNSAKAIGCSVVNIGAQDLIEGREHLVLGLIWQIIKMGLNAKIDIKLHPELFRLLEPGETLEEFLKLGPEQILLRWFNYHLKKAGWKRKVMNFSGDVKDAENYTVLLNQLAPHLCSRSPLQTRDIFQRAEQVLENAAHLNCRKYLSAKTLTEGNSKLNFAFVANLFNNHPGLERLTDAEMAQLDDSLFNSEGSREARAFALWLNSLPVDPFVNNLFDDLQDGLVLLQAIDYVRPGMVDWKKVNKAPVPSKFKKVENTNYVIVLGKALRFTLVGIQGSDITDGQKTLTLGLVWQLMREHVIQTLLSLSKSGVSITDQDIISWANSAVKRGGKNSSISQFKDPALRSGVYLLDLLNGIKKGIVNYELVTGGMTEEGAHLNAKYAISIARKMGATIFVLPEDIVEVKPKMILTFVGTLMALDRSGALSAQ